MAEIGIEKGRGRWPEVDLPIVDWGMIGDPEEEPIEPAKTAEVIQTEKLLRKEDDKFEPFTPEYLRKKELKREDLVSNENFIASARNVLRKREKGRYETYKTNEDVFEGVMNHFRHQDVNELTAINDLAYVLGASTAEKQDFYNLMTAYDKITGEAGTWDFFEDYAGGLVRAPSTWIGLFTGGGGKIGAIAAQQGIKLTIREIVKASLRKAMIPAGIEAIAGGIQGGTVSEARKEVGMASNTPLAIFVGAGIGAATGLTIGGLTSAAAIRKGQKLGKIMAEGDKTFGEALDAATREAGEIYHDAGNKEFVDTFLGTLAHAAAERNAAAAAKVKKQPLPRGPIEEGMKVKRGEAFDIPVVGARDPKGRLIEGEVDYLLSLSGNSIKRVTAAVYDILRAAKIDPNTIKNPKTKRVTELIYEAMVKKDEQGRFINEGLITEIDEIAKKYRLNNNEFAAMFIADASEAGRLLGMLSALQRKLQKGSISQNKFDKKIGALETDYNRFIQTLTKKLPLPEAVKEAVEKHSRLFDVGRAGRAVWDWVRNIDILRRGFMVIQPKTTIRNMANAGIRVPMYMLDNILAGRGGPKGMLDTMFLPFDFITRGEADAFAHVFQKGNSKQAEQMFMAAMDLNVQVGKGKWSHGTVIGSMARKMNVINTMMDNGIKRTIFFNEIKLAVGGSTKLKKLMEEGSLNDWLARNPNAMARAMDEALGFTYQKGFKDNIAGSWFVRQSNNPFFTAVIPFPRYLANQTQFIYEHMPLLSLAAGVLKISRQVPTKVSFRDRLAKNITGASMIYAAMQVRALQGPETPWYAVKDSDGNPYDTRALMGPYAPSMFLADFIYRVTSGGLKDPSIDKNWFPVQAAKKYAEFDYNQLDWREFGKAFTGTGARGIFDTGLVIIDELADAGQELAQAWAAGMEEGSQEESQYFDKMGRRLLANYIRTFTIPVGVAKDVIGTFDPKGTEYHNKEDYDLGAYFYKHVLASLPPPDALPEGKLKALMQEKMGKGVVEEKPELLYIPERRGYITSVRPLFPSFTGATAMLEQSEFQKELVRLQIKPTEFYQKDKDPARNWLKKYFMGINVLRLEATIAHGDYQSKNPRDKRAYLFAGRNSPVSQIRAEANKYADQILSSIRLSEEEGVTSTTKDRAKYVKLPRYAREHIEEVFRKDGKDIQEDNLYRQALDATEIFMKNRPDLFATELPGFE